jgi:hypothetical protein
MQTGKGPPRPKAWCEKVVFCCTYFRRDHSEQLLQLRKDYRAEFRKYGRRNADRFASRQAMLWLFCTMKEAAIGVFIIGRRIFTNS